jgi:beta-glucanase (GH16 family)
MFLMPVLRALGASALSLLVPAALVLVSAPGSASEIADDPAPSTPARSSAKQTVRLVAWPQIVQPGGRVASPEDAKAAFTATIEPIAAGRKVRLQLRRGSSWQTVATVGQNRAGRAEFAARASVNGRALTYRVKAASFQGLPSIKSSTVSTERWLTPTWTDGFSGDSLSEDWNHRGQTYEPQSLRRCSRGSAKAVRVGEGALRLSILRDPSRDTKCPALRRGEIAGRYAYRLNGHIGTDSAFSFKYGVAAARIKFPRLRGQHGSFWMQPVGGMYPGGTGHEIDVIEFFGGTHNRSGLFSYIHRYEGGHMVKAGANIPDTFLHGPRDGWGKKFHVFSVQWTPRSLIFRIDGKETWRVGGRVSQVPQYLILSLLSSDYELPQIQDRQLPQHMYVDWVRVWETGR